MFRYADGTEARLYDIVNVNYGPDQYARARVMAIGPGNISDRLDGQFVEWVLRDGLLHKNCVIVEWIDGNPLAHDEPNYAPVGNQMFLEGLEDEELVQRGS